RYLPGRGLAENVQPKTRSLGHCGAIHCQRYRRVVKFDSGPGELEVFCYTHKLHEARNRLCVLGENPHFDHLEGRSGHPTKEGFHVSASSLESKPAKVRECDM